MELIRKYFKELTNRQLEQFEAMLPLYQEWNSKINVISRKDMVNFYEHHVLHSLAIARYIQFRPDTQLLDVGTGGGFPGIPLAIIFPESQFLLVDSIGKKIFIVQKVIDELRLTNVNTRVARAEVINQRFDFVISRAVTSLPTFVSLIGNKYVPNGKNKRPNGILYLKGGDIQLELDKLPKRLISQVHPLNQWFDEPFFEAKFLVHLF